MSDVVIYPMCEKCKAYLGDKPKEGEKVEPYLGTCMHCLKLQAEKEALHKELMGYWQHFPSRRERVVGKTREEYNNE